MDLVIFSIIYAAVALAVFLVCALAALDDVLGKNTVQGFQLALFYSVAWPLVLLGHIALGAKRYFTNLKFELGG